VCWLGLRIDPVVHRARITQRARAQFATGLVEARGLRQRYDPALPAFSAIGYREAWSVLDGERTLEAAIEVDAHRNAQFAKRQMTWFRAEPEIGWLDGTTTDPCDAALAAARRVTEAVRRPTKP
jgi:tRNA dimethylallyltransferase